VPRVDSDEVERWRKLNAAVVLAALAVHAKRDPAFEPIKDHATTRWHANVGGRDFELLLTGAKFFDTRAERGGGGAIDLAMHLLNVDFRRAADLLRKARV
jgi:hypothetical protein